MGLNETNSSRISNRSQIIQEMAHRNLQGNAERAQNLIDCVLRVPEFEPQRNYLLASQTNKIQDPPHTHPRTAP